jgi:hypothetical protein
MIVDALIGFVLLGVIGADVSGSPASMRQLQVEPLKYRVNYSADFQILTDVLCEGPPPVLVVTCYGNLTNLNMSDESITCNPLQEPLIVSGTSYECKTSCIDPDCENFYQIQSDTDVSINGPFGSITFICEGDTINQVDASFLYRGGGNKWNLLGVKCPWTQLSHWSIGSVLPSSRFEPRICL